MSDLKRNNLIFMQKVADQKKGYGIAQVDHLAFSPKSKIVGDEQAMMGKKILREKIYGKI